MLYIAGLIRVIFAFIACFSFNLPIWVKYIIIGMLDRLDCSPDLFPSKGPLLSNDTSICETLEYQIVDKIVDSICYLFLLLSSKKQVNPNQYKILSYFYFYRLIGTFLFILTKYEDILIIFPNIFFELILAFSLFPKIDNNILVFIITLIKICVEISMHSTIHHVTHLYHTN